MLPNDPVGWWTAFGAIGQAVGAIATAAAVIVSLWIALSERALRAQGSAGIRVSFAGDGTPGIYMVGIEVTNIGQRTFKVSSVGWRTGWLSKGPQALTYQFAIQNESLFMGTQRTPAVLDPGMNQGFYMTIADMKGGNSDETREAFFGGSLPVLGQRPIRAMVNIIGRQPLFIKIPASLAEFLRTGVHADHT